MQPFLNITRIKNNDEGKSCFEDAQIPIEQKDAFGFLTEYYDSKATAFWGVAKGYDHFHNAIKKQLVVLGGRFRVTTTDGDTRLFKAGDIVLAEDTEFDGHNVAYLDEDFCVSIFVELTTKGMDELLSLIVKK